MVDTTAKNFIDGPGGNGPPCNCSIKNKIIAEMNPETGPKISSESIIGISAKSKLNHGSNGYGNLKNICIKNDNEPNIADPANILVLFILGEVDDSDLFK